MMVMILCLFSTVLDFVVGNSPGSLALPVIQNPYLAFATHDWVVPNIRLLKWLYVGCLAVVTILGHREGKVPSRLLLLNYLAYTPLAAYAFVNFSSLHWLHDALGGYSFLAYPALFLIMHKGITGSLSCLRSRLSQRDEQVFGLNKRRDNKYSIHLKTTKGTLYIRNPFTGLWVFGGPESGKSASIIDPLLVQFIRSGFTGVVYDFKGWVLTDTVFRTLQMLREKGRKGGKRRGWIGRVYPGRAAEAVPSFHLIDFTNPMISDRLNILSPKWITSSVMAKSVATILANSIEKKWIKDRDFWANNAIAILHGSIWNLAKNYPDRCSLPHLVAAITSDLDSFMAWLNEDVEIQRIMRPISDAIKMEAGGQVAGALSTIQIPMNTLMNPDFFWAFSEGGRINIDVNHPDSPAWVCICSDEIRHEGLSPGISLVLSFLSVWINRKGRLPCVFAIDELPTTYVANLQNLPATGRSNRLATLVGLQVFSQLQSRLGEGEADMIRGALANQWWGNTTSKEAEELSRAIGQVRRVHYDSTTAGDGGVTLNKRRDQEDVIKVRDIMTQPAGHFTGKVKNGKPAWFSAQFRMLDSYVKFRNPRPEPDKEYHNRDYLNELIRLNYVQTFEEVHEMLDRAKARQDRSSGDGAQGA